MEPIITQTDNPTTTPEKQKKPKGMLIGLISCAVLAAGGIGFGIYEMIQNQAISRNMSELREQFENPVALAMDQTAEKTGKDEELVSTTKTVAQKNPIISSQPPINLTYNLISDPTQIDRAEFYRLSLGVHDGEVSHCFIDTSSQYNEGWHSHGDCEVSGLSGKVYKAIKIGEGQDGIYDAIGFIMEDGSVEYLKQYEAIDDMDFSIDGKLNIDGFVVDSFQASVHEDHTIGGHITTVFITSDGKTIMYDPETMY